jgi:hypothetical protein
MRAGAAQVLHHVRAWWSKVREQRPALDDATGQVRRLLEAVVAGDASLLGGAAGRALGVLIGHRVVSERVPARVARRGGS